MSAISLRLQSLMAGRVVVMGLYDLITAHADANGVDHEQKD